MAEQATVQKTDEELESAAFDARTSELYPDPGPGPLDVADEGSDEPVLPPEIEAGSAGAEGTGGESDLGDAADAAAVESASTPDEEAQAVKAFIGDLTDEQVLEKLKRIDEMDGLADSVFEKVSSRVFGKFGEIGQQIQSLQDREFRFDPEKLTNVKELDDGLAEALTKDLKEAFSGQSFDRDELIEQVGAKNLAEMDRRMNVNLLAAMVPNAPQISQKEEFADWFFKVAGHETREVFENWDNGTELNAPRMIAAYAQFNAWEAEQKAAEQSQKATKDDAVARSVETTKRSAAPAARRHMTEEEAFAARSKEISK